MSILDFFHRHQDLRRISKYVKRRKDSSPAPQKHDTYSSTTYPSHSTTASSSNKSAFKLASAKNKEASKNASMSTMESYEAHQRAARDFYAAPPYSLSCVEVGGYAYAEQKPPPTPPKDSPMGGRRGTGTPEGILIDLSWDDDAVIVQGGVMRAEPVQLPSPEDDRWLYEVAADVAVRTTQQPIIPNRKSYDASSRTTRPRSSSYTNPPHHQKPQYTDVEPYPEPAYVPPPPPVMARSQTTMDVRVKRPTTWFGKGKSKSYVDVTKVKSSEEYNALEDVAYRRRP
ncbi:uncharacterized protein EV422DRAFT_577704 [Fimicolochytrium jonesii]|uniref:uncharacterized protein n=1 Tax=Fimicolochytrium jonesii TaxID=1396493 RepID=UPI0022FDF898|nr:uncharacterized protein EV422DRAFT_577704 [Fimicolochytrium jonesii]KAI8822690.1 hypothetical protein EV422DRAFT_577704 [Fimicolochytrium jonesii]